MIEQNTANVNINMLFTEKNKPNFFIVGAPKAGTTTFYYLLQQHPDIFLPDHKEPNYFSIKDIDAQNLYCITEDIRSGKEYAALFSGVDSQKVIGEGSVSYLFYKKVPQRIYSFNPDANIVILLRNPVDRAYSHYLMDYRKGYTSLDFEDVVYRRKNHRLMDLYYQQYIELGFYDKQIKRYLDLFGSRVHIMLYDQLKEDIDVLLNELFEILKIDKAALTLPEKYYNQYKNVRTLLGRKIYGHNTIRTTLKSLLGEHITAFIRNIFVDTSSAKPVMNKETRTHLAKVFKPHILETQKLIEPDITHWLSK